MSAETLPPRRQRPVHRTLLRSANDLSGREPPQSYDALAGGSKKLRTTPWTKMLRHDLGI